MNQTAPPYDAVIAAPFGAVGISVRGVQVSIDLLSQQSTEKLATHKLVASLSQQVAHYLHNAQHEFNLPLVYKGTPYQRLVWQAISAIPRGQVLTYSEIAAQIGSGPRAVANACGANHLPLVIPCHRVVAKSGLGGFMKGVDGGLEIKKWLLKHEGVAFKNNKPIKPTRDE
jgi:methylated-DNA-[protein]-cysteine S-methyltransferase